MMIVLAMAFSICQAQVSVETIRDLSYRKSDHQVPLRRVVGKSPIFFQSKMSCDVDGSPNAYHPLDDDLALDVIGSAGGKRVGDANAGALTVPPSPDVVVYDHGKPYIQPSGEFEGYYVSETSLADSSRAPIDPTKYLDAREIQYIVLPDGLCPEARLGDLAAVYDPESKKVVFAVYGDIGPSPESGEASIATLRRLGLNTPDGKSSPGEFRDDLFYLVFPGTAQKLLGQAPWPHLQSAIDRLAKTELETWGGVPQIQQIVSQENRVGSVPDNAKNQWIYNELALCQANGWIHTVSIGLPSRLSQVPGRLPCATEIVLACRDGIDKIQNEVERAERMPGTRLDPNLAFHLRKLAEMIRQFPVADQASDISPQMMGLRTEALVARLQKALETSLAR